MSTLDNSKAITGQSDPKCDKMVNYSWSLAEYFRHVPLSHSSEFLANRICVQPYTEFYCGGVHENANEVIDLVYECM